MMNIVLVEPEIPQNTGNIARTCALLFGKETKGLPEDLIYGDFDNAITVPMAKGKVRSLNLSNTVALVLYEGLRQLNFKF